MGPGGWVLAEGGLRCYIALPSIAPCCGADKGGEQQEEPADACWDGGSRLLIGNGRKRTLGMDGNGG